MSAITQQKSVRTGLPVHTWVCTKLPAERHLPGRECGITRRLQSASSADLIVPATQHTTMGDCAFTVAAPRAWNSLPDTIRRSPSLAVFKRSLKTYFYTQCFY